MLKPWLPATPFHIDCFVLLLAPVDDELCSSKQLNHNLTTIRCDTPYSLALAALQSIATLTGTGTDQANVAWALYTGDLVSHDTQNQLSRAYVEYTETSKKDPSRCAFNKLTKYSYRCVPHAQVIHQRTCIPSPWKPRLQSRKHRRPPLITRTARKTVQLELRSCF